MRPDAQERPGQGAPEVVLATKLADAPEATAPALTVDASEVLVLDAELAVVLHDRREATR